MKSSVGKYIEEFSHQLVSLFSSTPKDIVDAIKMDHQALRNYLDTLKDTDQPMAKRRAAYKSFSDLLKSHTIAEEQAVYTPSMKLVGKEMHIKVSEGYVEHSLAEDLMGRIEKQKNALKWSASANVLSEIVEHHLKEEERDLLPLIRKAASGEKNHGMLKKFVSLRAKTQKHKTKKSAGVLS